MKCFSFVLGSFLLNSVAAQTTCEKDEDCSGVQYCATGECLDHSMCKIDVDCFNPSNSYFSIFCVGYTECQGDACSTVCDETGTGAQCKDGSKFESCLVAPCSVDKCSTGVSCVDDYCGGCNAIHFDVAGTQVCMGDDELPIATDIPTTCQRDEDCSPTQAERLSTTSYCAQGICLEHVSCTTDLDCFNPSNVYLSIACAGITGCRGGACSTLCDETAVQCKDGSTFENCLVAPCSVDKCDNGVSCVNDYCGGCNAIHFDLAGNQACNGNIPSAEFLPTIIEDIPTVADTTPEICQGIEGCDNDQYCASGTCLDFSTCQMDLDCLNPDNEFTEDDCEGSVECEVGQCIKICDSDDPVDTTDDTTDAAYTFSMTCMWVLSLAPILFA
jgi:hypothetical protein